MAQIRTCDACDERISDAEGGEAHIVRLIGGDKRSTVQDMCDTCMDTTFPKAVWMEPIETND